jgi:hypothetical protein
MSLLYFADTTEREDRAHGVKGGPKIPKDRVTLGITLFNQIGCEW